MGTKLKFERVSDPLLTLFRFGAAYRYLNDMFIFSGDIVKPRGLSLQGNLGIEFNYRDLISLRGGYRVNQDLSGADALSLGVGLKYRDISFDMHLLPLVISGTRIASQALFSSAE